MSSKAMINTVVPLELFDLLQKGCVILTPENFRALRVGIKHGVSDPELRQELLDLPVYHVSQMES